MEAYLSAATTNNINGTASINKCSRQSGMGGRTSTSEGSDTHTHTQLYSVNVNGFALDRYGGKFDEHCQVLNEILVQGDVGCVQEHNLDTTQQHVTSQLYATALRRWQWYRMSIAMSPIRFSTQYKPDGTIIISASSLSSRTIAIDSDKWGRWTNQTYQGKGNNRVTINSIYQVVDSRSALQGQNTVASQQQALLAAVNGPISTDPRQGFCQDLKVSISDIQAKGHDIILT